MTQLSRILSPLVLRPPAMLNLYQPALPNHQVWPSAAFTGMVDCGALDQDVWKEIVNIQAPGILRFLCVMNASEAPKDIGLRITIDGEQVAEDIIEAISVHGHGLSTDIGALTGSLNTPALLTAPFTHLQVHVLSSMALSAGNSLHYLLDYYLVKS